MSNGLEHNNLNDISAVYLKEISEGRLKQLEKASALAASDNPDDQDKAREIRVRFDYESLKKQIGSKKKPTKPAIKEEVECDCDCGQDPCVQCGDNCHDIKEGLSDWREELREIVGQYAGTAQVNANLEQQPDGSKKKTSNDKVTEKNVKNKIKINPTFQESAEQLAENLGGQLLSIHEVLDTEEDDSVDGEKKEDPKEAQKKKMELQMKKRIIRMKLRAANSGEADGIVAGYEPEGEVVSELKTGTLLSYSQKAANQLAFKGDGSKKAQKRATGIKKAAGKMAIRATDPDGSLGFNKNVKNEEVVSERLGGKGYKRRKDYAGREVSGDWEDSDRGSGNKATRRSGGTVKKKSPTYQAYVLNKEENVFKSAMKRVFKKKEEERKPEKAQDAGARAKRLLARKVHAKYVSGSEDNVPDDIRDHYEVIDELNRYGKETGKATGSLNKRAGTPVKKGGDEPGALRNVRGMIRKETGKPQGQKRSDYDARGRGQDRKEKPSTTIARIRQLAKDADKAMRDTSGT